MDDLKCCWVVLCHWINSMIVLVKNLYTVHILIWLIQMRNPHHLWWRSKACSDIARRSTYVQICTMLWRRAALRTHSLSMPECAFWAGPNPPNQTTTPPPQTNNHIPKTILLPSPTHKYTYKVWNKCWKSLIMWRWKWSHNTRQKIPIDECK